MNGTEVRARVARLRSDWENAKRDHTQANASQAGVELLVGFFEDITKDEDEHQEQTQLKEGSGAPAPPTTPDATGVPGEQKPAIVEGTQAPDDTDKQAPAGNAEATTDTAKAAS